MVWGKEGKPASRRRWGLLKAACIMVEFLILFLFLIFFFFLTGGGLQGRLRWQILRPCRPVWEENGLLQPQQSQGHGHSAPRQVWGERTSTASRAETAGRRAPLTDKLPVSLFVWWIFQRACHFDALWPVVTWRTGGYRYIITLMSWGSERRLWPGSFLFQRRVGGFSELTGLRGWIKLAELGFVPERGREKWAAQTLDSVVGGKKETSIVVLWRKKNQIAVCPVSDLFFDH